MNGESERIMMAVAEILKAAGEPTRVRLLNLLRLRSASVTDLQDALGIPQPMVSYHLAVLRHAGLVADVRRGNRIVYSLVRTAAPWARGLKQLLQCCCPGEEVLRRDAVRFVRAGHKMRQRRPKEKKEAPSAPLAA